MDRDYQFSHAAISQQQNDDEMSSFKANICTTARMRFFSTSTCLSSKIILALDDVFNANICTAGMGFFNLDFYEARFKALLGEIWFFAFSSLIWPLEWLSEPNLDLLFLSGLLPLTQRPLVRLGPPLRRDLDGSA